MIQKIAKLPQRRTQPRRSRLFEPLEGRTLHSDSPMPVIVATFGGTQLSEQSVFQGESGHGVDPDMQRVAGIADRIVKNWNPQSKSFFFNWGTLGNATKEGDLASQTVLSFLSAHASQQYKLVVIGYSQGAYPAVELENVVVRAAANVQTSALIELAPTGIAGLHEGQIAPPVWGTRVTNYTYYTGTNIFGSLTVGNYPQAGTVVTVAPDHITDPIAAHEDEPLWFAGVGSDNPGQANGPEANLLINTILGADAYKSSTARLAAGGSLLSTDVTQTIYIPGSGPPLAIDVLRSMFSGGVTQFVDDARTIVELGADKAGDLIVTMADSPGKYLSGVFNGADNVIQSVEETASSIVDAASSGLHDLDKLLFGWWP